MFQINDDLSIYATRGDLVFFAVAAEDNGKPYTFQPGDVVRFKVYEKKSAESVVMRKVFEVLTETDRVDIILTGDDMKFGDVISKPTDYWYEIELNPFTNPHTIIGYDEDGAKIFRLYPEGADVAPEDKPYDVETIDVELDMNSDRPVQNQAITRAIVQVFSDVTTTIADAQKTLTRLRVFDSHLTSTENPHEVTAHQTGATTEEDVLNIRFSKAGTTTFGEDGNITTTYEDGSSEKTVFNDDGSITATRYVKGVAVKTATTTFNADGSVTVKEGEIG